MVVGVQADGAGVVRQRACQGLVHLGQRGVEFFSALLQGVGGLGRLVDELAVVGLLGLPLRGRVQKRRRVGVAARPRHIHIARAETVAQAQDHAQLPVVPVGGVIPGLAGLRQVVGVAGGDEGVGRIAGDLPATRLVQPL